MTACEKIDSKKKINQRGSNLNVVMTAPRATRAVALLKKTAEQRHYIVAYTAV